MAIISPVATMPTSSWWLPMKCMMPSGKVRLSSSVSSTTAYRNSFHRMMKLSVTVVKIAGSADRQGDAPEDLEIGIAVHPRRIEQVLRDLREEALEDVDGHRQMAGDVDDDEAGQRVVEPVFEQDLEQREDQQLRRQDHAGQDDEAHQRGCRGSGSGRGNARPSRR